MKWKAASGIVLTLLVACLLLLILPVGAVSRTVLSVQPTSVVDQTLVPGSVFRVSVTLANVKDLWGYQFSLWFDPAILSVVDSGLYPGVPDFWHYIEVDGSYVAVIVFTADWGAWTGFSTVNAVSIAWIDFVVLDVGATRLHFDMWWTELADVRGNAIKVPWNLVVVDGYFDNRVL